MDVNQIGPLIDAANAAASSASKSGFRSSEFWGHILAGLPLLAACFGGPAAPILLAAGAIGQLAAGIYTASRTKAKINGVLLARDVAEAAARNLPAPALPSGANAR